MKIISHTDYINAATYYGYYIKQPQPKKIEVKKEKPVHRKVTKIDLYV